MRKVERLGRWKDEGAITLEQHDALGVIVRKDRFSVALELNALLYLGVVAVAGGVLWTVQTHFTTIGDTARSMRSMSTPACEKRVPASS